MTKTQRFEELFSILGADIHSDNSHILEKKKDIQKNVEKILKLIGEGNDAKSEVVSLIKDFHKGCEDLYDRHGQLIEEGLKKETENRVDSLNDSESEEHSKEDKSQLSSKNVELSSEREKLKFKLEALYAIEDELNQKKAAEEKEKEGLKLLHMSLSSKVQEDKATINNLTISCEQLKKQLEAKEEEVCSLTSQLAKGEQKLMKELTDLQIEHSELLANYKQLERKLDTREKDSSEIEQCLEAAKGKNLKNIDGLKKANGTVKELEKKLMLRDENSILNQSKIKLKEAEKLADSFKADIQQLRDTNSKLQVNLDDAIQKKKTVDSHLDKLKKENVELHEGKNTIASELSDSETKRKNLETELEQARRDTTTLQQTEKDLYRRNSDLERRLKATQEKLDEKTMHANKFQKELHLLSTQTSEAEEELKKREQRCLEYRLVMKNFEETLASKIATQQTRLTNLKGFIGEIFMNCKQPKDRYSELPVKIETLKLEKCHKELAEKLEVETEELSSKNEHLSSENGNLNLKLQAAEKEKRGLQSEIMTSANKQREAESTINIPATDSEQPKKQLKAKENENMELLAKCVELQHRLEAREKDASENKAILEAAEGEDSKIVDELKKENSTLTEIEKKLKQLRGENSVLDQIKIKLKEANFLSAQKSKAEEEIRKLEENNKKLAEKLEFYEAERAGAREEIAKQYGEVRRLKSHLLQRNQKITKIEKDLQAIRQQNDQDCARLSSLDAQLAQRKGDAKNEKNEQEQGS